MIEPCYTRTRACFRRVFSISHTAKLLLGAAAIVFVLLAKSIPHETLKHQLFSCPQPFSDITDEAVKALSLSLSPDPYIPIKAAWLKPEATRYGAAVKEIPEVLKDKFTMHGEVPVQELYFDEAYLGGSASTPVWTIEMIDNLRTQVQERSPAFNYDNTPLYAFFDARKEIIAGKRGLVIGSESPWLESMLLEYGARHITTLEFGKIESQHPNISTYTPQKFTWDSLADKIDKFDFAFTFSSIEHDGLGRYGDLLNPDGDLQTMAKLLTIIKPGGYVMVGVPCCHDRLDWNAHRVYGPLRLPLLFSGYSILGVYPSDSKMGDTSTDFGYQPVWLLQNTWACRPRLRKCGPEVLS